MRRKINNWLLALALTLPMLVFFLSYLFHHDPDLEPTGFIQYDNVSYIAYAKQYLDSDRTGIMYNNPFNDSDNYKPIYFQPHIALFAIVMNMGVSSGWVLIIFALVCTLITFRLLIVLYDHIFSNSKYRFISILILAWGGGLLALSGFILKIFDPSVQSIFHLDPAAGWWGLNLGRSLFFSCEAYYHLLFFAVIVSILKRKWTLALATSFLLSVSHPFTGAELLCIVTAWCFFERVIIRKNSIPSWFLLGMVLLLSFHAYYYLYYLNQFPEHRSVSEQYELNWRLRYFNMIPAYCLVGVLALASLIVRPLKHQILRESYNRLFIAWFVVAFLLANHELFMKPMQPIHFTRGYIWTSLLLLGLPALHLLFDRIAPAFRNGVIALIIVIFLSDNIAWIWNYVYPRASGISTSYISNEEKQVFEAIEKNSESNTLLISEDPNISYLSTVYTKVYTWHSHPFTTPFAKEKQGIMDQFISNGDIPARWQNRPLVMVFRKSEAEENKRSIQLPITTTLILDTKNYRVLRSGQ